jgi:hypothetical protein
MPGHGRRLRVMPPEHGTWAMLIAPALIGAAVDGRVTGAEVSVMLGALVLFLAHTQLLAAWRLRRARQPRGPAGAPTALALAFGAAGLAAVSPLLLAAALGWVLALAGAVVLFSAASLWLVAARLDHALPGQALAALGLSLSGPATYAAGGGASARVGLAIWVVSAAYFLWAVLYVRMKIMARARRAPLVAPGQKLAFAGPTLAIDLGLLAVVALALALGGLGSRVLVAFLPAGVQALAGVATLDRPAPLKRVGIAMTVHAALFAALVIALAR